MSRHVIDSHPDKARPGPDWPRQLWFNKKALAKSHEEQFQDKEKSLSRGLISSNDPAPKPGLEPGSEPGSKPGSESGSESGSVATLAPIRFHELVLGNRHRGRILEGHVYLRPYGSVVAVRFLLEDEADSDQAINVAVYDLGKLLMGDDDKKTPRELERLFPPGSGLGIKEPYFERCTDGMVGIRIENAADIVFRRSEGEIPKQPSPSTSSLSVETRRRVEEIREEGNKFYKSRKYAEALARYKMCIKLDPTDAAAQRNISAVHVATKDWLRAWSHAKKALELDPSNTKSHYRRAWALLMLGCYQDGAKFMQDLHTKEPGNKEFGDAVSLAKELLEESQGHFSAAKVYDKSQPRKIYGDYVGPVALKLVDGKGRGLVATRKVHAGELVFVSNPLAFVSLPLDDVGLKSKNEEDKAMANFVSVFRSKCSSCILAHATLSMLCDGSRRSTLQVPSVEMLMPPQTEMELLRRIREAEKLQQKSSATVSAESGGKKQDKDRSVVIDIEHARKVARFNSFLSADGITSSEVSVGIWTLAAFVNHSCIPNANILGIQDVLMLRAGRDIEEGEEIVHSYVNPTNSPVGERRKILKDTWDFQCNCERCVLESTQLSKKAIKAMKKITTDIMSSSGPSSAPMTSAYMDARSRQDVPRLLKIIAMVQKDLSQLEKVLKNDLGSGEGVKWCQVTVVHAQALIREATFCLQYIDTDGRADKFLKYGMEVLRLNLDMLKLALEVVPGNHLLVALGLAAMVHGKTTLAKSVIMEVEGVSLGPETVPSFRALLQSFQAKVAEAEAMVMDAIRRKFGRELTDDEARAIVGSAMFMDGQCRREGQEQLFVRHLGHLANPIGSLPPSVTPPFSRR